MRKQVNNKLEVSYSYILYQTCIYWLTENIEESKANEKNETDTTGSNSSRYETSNLHYVSVVFMTP